jgi:hypothetical protein
MADESSVAACPRCATLEEEVVRLRMERQLLIEQLGSERARANAMFLTYAPPPPPEVPPLQLRHKLVDALNDFLYRLPGYQMARRAGQAVLKATSG